MYRRRTKDLLFLDFTSTKSNAPFWLKLNVYSWLGFFTGISESVDVKLRIMSLMSIEISILLPQKFIFSSKNAEKCYPANWHAVSVNGTLFWSYFELSMRCSISNHEVFHKQKCAECSTRNVPITCFCPSEGHLLWVLGISRETVILSFSLRFFIFSIWGIARLIYYSCLKHYCQRICNKVNFAR